MTVRDARNDGCEGIVEMLQDAGRTRVTHRLAPSRPLGGMLLIAGLMLAGAARAEEPPITSLEDAACRAEAKARVFSVPDPLNLGLREIGKRLYFGCMKRSKPAHRGKSRRHRRR